jgi:phage antirepressor YoqD-like protein
LLELKEYKMEKELEIRVRQELEKILENPREALKIMTRAWKDAEAEIEVLKPKAENYDICMSTDKLIEMSAVAKTINFIGFGRNNLFSYLRDAKILRYNNEPYQSYVDAGYFKIVRQAVSKDYYEGIYEKTMVTQKGIDFIIKKLREDGYARHEG